MIYILKERKKAQAGYSLICTILTDCRMASGGIGKLTDAGPDRTGGDG